MILLKNRTRRAATALSVAAALVATPALTACAPNPPSLSCFDYGVQYNIGFYGVPQTIASVRTGAKICMSDVATIYSVDPYAEMNPEGIGTTPMVDEGVDGAHIVYSNSGQAMWEGSFHARNCPAGSWWWLSYLCQPTTHIHFQVVYTAPLHIGGTGLTQWWDTGANFLQVR